MKSQANCFQETVSFNLSESVSVTLAHLYLEQRLLKSSVISTVEPPR